MTGRAAVQARAAWAVAALAVEAAWAVAVEAAWAASKVVIKYVVPRAPGRELGRG